MALGIPAGQVVFLDSTILHYAFVEFPSATQQCVELLQRISRVEIRACLTAPGLNDAIHKVMCSEAKERFELPRSGLVNWFKSNPKEVRQLTAASDALRLVQSLPISFLVVDLAALIEAQQAVKSHGLLASDALIVALMKRNQIPHLERFPNEWTRGG